MQAGRNQEAGGFKERSLYSKLFQVFQLDSYFRHPALVQEGSKALEDIACTVSFLTFLNGWVIFAALH